MTPNDFLLKFTLAVIAVLALVYAFTYFEEKDNGLEPAPNHAVTLPLGEPSGGDVPAVTDPGVGTELSPLSNIKSRVEASSYSIEKYPVNYGLTGDLKNISADAGAIVIIAETGEEVRAVVTDATEIFRNGVRAELSNIKTADRISILGRKNTEDSDEFVADKIYATEITDNTPIPVSPIVLPVEE